MALDLSFKDLVEAAARNPGMDGRPLLIPLSRSTKIATSHGASSTKMNLPSSRTPFD